MSAADPFGLVGQVLDGQFRVDNLVGEGGFSAVYRGHHQGLNEPIAIKSLKLPAALDPPLVDIFVQRFRDESRILYRLSQGNLHIVRSIAAGTTQSPATGALVPYMVLEWLEGRSLQNDYTVRRTLGQSGRSIEELVKLFDTAADGLGYAHAQGVVHRDLNPGNLFLAVTQHGVKMKVLDFGVAKLMHEGALNMGPRQQTVGQIKIFAPAYGAPEQFDDRVGAVGAHSDVYSFALILLEALRDKCVNEGTHIGEYAQFACDPNRRPTPRSLGIDVPDEVEAAFARATALDPKARWQSAAEFWQSLTIAVKVASERRHEAAARETPPLAMTDRGKPHAIERDRGGATLAIERDGPPPGLGPVMGMAPGSPPLQPKDAAIGGKNLLKGTLPLGATNLPRPAPGAPRVRIPTTIGIPPPARSGSSASNKAVLAPAGAARTLVSPPSAPPAALAPPAAPPRTTARPPSSQRNPAQAMPAVQPLSPVGVVRGPLGAQPAPRFPSDHDLPNPSGWEDDADGDAGSAPTRRASSSSMPAAAVTASGGDDVIELPSMDPLEEEVDEATKVHAPTAEVLRTLSLHNAASARATADAMMARAREAAAAEAGGLGPDEASMLEAAARGAAFAPSPHVKPPYVDPNEDIPEPPESGGTLMMAPVAQRVAQQQQHAQQTPPAQHAPPPPQHRSGGLGATLAMAMPMTPGFAFAPASPHHGSAMQQGSAPPPQQHGHAPLGPPTPQHDWQAATMAFGSQTPNVLEAPGMQGIPGAHGTPPQGVPAINTTAPLHPPYPAGAHGSASISPMAPGGAPFGAAHAQHAQPSGPHGMQQSQQHGLQHNPQQPPDAWPRRSPAEQSGGFGRSPAEHAFPPPTFAPAATAPKLPIVGIAIVLGVLALGGIGLGVFALRSRGHAGTDHAAPSSSIATDVAPDTSVTPVPVPVPDEPTPVPAVTPSGAVDPAPASAVPAETAVPAPVVPPAIAPPPVAPPPVTPPPVTPPPGNAPPPAGVANTPPTPSTKPAADPNAFSEPTARAKLGQANGILVICKKEGGVTGPGNASVTFGPDGSVSGVAVDPPYAGTKEGDCVASAFRRAKVSPFTGTPQTVRHSFEVPK